jgi:sRNA-binding carbon storage regulator CsrA
MTLFTRQVDQWIIIGDDIRVSPTDVDAQGVRLVAHGRILGGPNDGAPFNTVHELTVGQSCHFGPHVAVTVVEVRGETVRLGVLAPAHVPVYRKEQVDQLRGK